MAQDIFDLLAADHDQARRLLAEMDETSPVDSARRRRQVAQLRQLLTAHQRAEEAAFYRPLKEREETHDLALEGYEEHRVTHRLVQDLDQLDPGNERWRARFAVLREVFEHHAREEEEQFFGRAREVLGADQAQELGRRFQEERGRRLKVA